MEADFGTTDAEGESTEESEEAENENLDTETRGGRMKAGRQGDEEEEGSLSVLVSSLTNFQIHFRSIPDPLQIDSRLFLNNTCLKMT